ncbi:ABC transporter ATP-binding protein [Actinomadura madurae]|uniref:ABC transporter ATP-binding protein n=1 Tax=Actinomadura madurae TaxID=1993 RepID=UPI00202723BC|nr:ABC transporter ATP-binding protein [Actinomadura madurae]MCP9950899.1 ABC transporter ATP-binding protein [Actinomadura madurae]MCP9967688.1 ABC transporter ATP-binding protein [Actinomadura madurae]MCP9980134.1 ABC transporter ATP-binding protein [Actinomadura madurae]MCQ0008340.1 ABC transporter ATP-binding protein [Actinomadura madurae]MCQ0016347.1 ABC transporter ATP-binding protein [Actinomadura madurae]
MDLVLDDIEVVYRRRGMTTHAVRGVSVRVRRGETLAIVGESGSGKTTIAKVAAGLQKATSGSVAWRGEHAAGDSRDRRSLSRRVQMVFQHPMQSLDPLWKVRRSVAEPLRRSGLPGEKVRSLVSGLIEQVGLDASVLDSYPRELSGGQAQRVAIARALVCDPEIVILDEPTASLDQTVRARILARLARLQTETDVGYLMITHDISSVRRLATRIAVMYRGLIVESGPAGKVLADARHPYTRALIDAVPIADPRVPWKGVARLPRGPDGTFPDATCPVPGSPCARHGTGLHQIGPEHLVACTAR